MAKIEPVVSAAELGLIDNTAELTGFRRREVVTRALTVYQWFVGQALIGNTVAALKPTGEEVALKTAELAVLERKGNRLEPEELGALAKGLAAASNPIDAGRIKACLTLGFYGI